MNDEEFNEHMWNFNTYGFALVAASFGYELGLFDVLMKENKPMTSTEIAHEAHMKERYIREWLGCMVAARIISLDGDSYYIPQERNDTIRGSLSCGYRAIAWTRRFEQTKACFQEDGPWGFDYDSGDTFWKYFGDFRNKTGGSFLEKHILPSLESHPSLTGKLDSGIEVLDLGCGSGAFSISLARSFPKSKITGLDPCEKALAMGIENSQKQPLTNLEFIRGDAQSLGQELAEKYDLILIIDVLHDLPEPRKAMVEMSKAIKPDGKIVIVDIRVHSKQADNVGDMFAAMLYSSSMFCCLQCSLQGEPRIGYGACWGEEEMTKTIQEYLLIEKKVDLLRVFSLYICSRKQ